MSALGPGCVKPPTAPVFGSCKMSPEVPIVDCGPFCAVGFSRTTDESEFSHSLGRWRTPSTSPTGVRTRTYGLTALPPRRNAPFGVGERDSPPLHAKGGLEEFGRLVGDTAQSAGAMQGNHRGVAADAGLCRRRPGAAR